MAFGSVQSARSVEKVSGCVENGIREVVGYIVGARLVVEMVVG